MNTRSPHSVKPLVHNGGRVSDPTPTTPEVPREVRALLGPGWIVEGEDPDCYEELLAQVGAAAHARDIIDWLLVKDIVALSWEIQRTRRIRDTLLRTMRLDAMESILASLLPPQRLTLGESEASDLARLSLNGDEKAEKEVKDLLGQAGLTFEDVSMRAIATNAQEFDRLDEQTERHEYRRDALLRQIERRAGLAKRVSEDIVDVEFTSTRSGLVAPKPQRDS